MFFLYVTMLFTPKHLKDSLGIFPGEDCRNFIFNHFPITQLPLWWNSVLHILSKHLSEISRKLQSNSFPISSCIPDLSLAHIHPKNERPYPSDPARWCLAWRGAGATEVRFVHAVTAGVSGVNFSGNNAIYNVNESTKYILSWFYL